MRKMIALLFAGFLTTACAEEPKQQMGETLHNEKCTSCHKDDVYTRENRMVNSKPELEHQVKNCMKGPARAN